MKLLLSFIWNIMKLMVALALGVYFVIQGGPLGWTFAIGSFLLALWCTNNIETLLEDKEDEQPFTITLRIRNKEDEEDYGEGH